VFLHGALSNSHTWNKVIEIVSRKYRCIAPDLPLGGHAVPFDALADLSPRGLAEILDQFVEALGLKDMTLIGNDTGGAYAQIYTMLHPEKVSRLVLSNCDALEVFPPRQFASLQSSVRIPGYLWVMAQLFRFKPFLKTPMVLGLLSHTLSKEDIYAFYVHSFITNPGVRQDFKKGVLGWSPRLTQQAATTLTGFTRPVLLIWGDDDRALFPLELGRRLAAVFPRARFEGVAGALTYVQEDQPDEFAKRLFAFLSQSSDAATDNNSGMVVEPE
jgi:pimeloyl-ACP methyl ester carboxylesterase